jgi:hypothetical protein
MPTRNPNVVDYTSVEVDGTAANLFNLTDKLVSAKTGMMKCFIGTVETAAIRSRGDGTDPTAAEGQLIGVGDIIYMTESELEKTTFIADTGTSGFIRGHFYDVEVPNLIGKE